ncbi:MAG: hypothetical protein OHK0017_10680 [Patescibacteria group bacterium]
MSFQLKIYTPDELIFDGVVEEVQVPAQDGLMTILSNHMALTSQLDIGLVRIRIEGDRRLNLVAINGGTFTFRDNLLSISTVDALLIDRREKDSEIFPRAIQAKNSQIEQQIEEALKAGGYYEPDQTVASLLAEERIAKFEILKDLLNEV